MIPKLVDKTSAANSGKWAAPTTDMLEDIKTRNTTIRVRAGTKNSRPVGFLL